MMAHSKLNALKSIIQLLFTSSIQMLVGPSLFCQHAHHGYPSVHFCLPETPMVSCSGLLFALTINTEDTVKSNIHK